MNDPVVDLSHWNEEPDWDMLKANGTVGVILKATQGTNYVDDTYGKRAVAARDAGLMVASYHFLEHGDVEAQMQWYLERVGPQSGDRLVIDFEEDPNGYTATIDDLEMAVEILLSSGEYQVAVYGSGYLKDVCDGRFSDLLSRTSLWQARYSEHEPEVPTPWTQWDLWQYTQTGEPTGCIGETDCNRWHDPEDPIDLWFNNTLPDVIDDDVAVLSVTMTVIPPEDVRVRMHLDVTAPNGAAIVLTVNGQSVAEFGPVA